MWTDVFSLQLLLKKCSLINLPSSAIVYGAVKSEIVLEELWAVTF